jgi:hypothetical protein
MLMNAEQALLFLKQTLVIKPGLSLDDIAGIIQAWNLIAEKVRNDGGPGKESNQQDPA